MTVKTSGIFFLLVLFFLLPACVEVPARWDPLAYTVKQGDTLYSIAWRYEKDYRQVAIWNNIKPPYAIYPGQRLVMQASDQNGSVPNEIRPQVIVEEGSGQAIVIEAAEIKEQVPEIVKERPTQVTVKQDETLYAIARREGYSHHQLARWNRLKAPYVLKPGQALRLTPPLNSLGGSRQNIAKAGPVHSPVVKSLSQQHIKARPLVSSIHKSSASSGQPQAKSLPKRVARWRWPVKGRVVKTFKANDTSRKGIGIRGKVGQSVNAAAAGTVVYSGNGLINYGNLIIIKHSHSFLSAYAYNQSLLVKEGDSVKSGQAIAKIGNAESSGSQLHFEIRRNGKPVNPLNYLPKS